MNKVVQSNPQLAAAICEFLPGIDESLTASGCDLPSRPLKAATTFVKHFILKVEGGTKENPHEQEWFAIIFAVVADWYETKYGEAFRAKNDALVGVVEIHGLPFKVNVPSSYAVPHPSGELTNLCFGPALGSSEQPRQWIERPPALENLAKPLSDQLDRDLKSITRILRRINLNFMTGDPAPEAYASHRAAALAAIRKAGEHIAKGGESEHAFAVWEIHYALENGLKALIAQAGVNPEHHHDLPDLARQAKLVAAISIERDNLSFYPMRTGP